MTGILGAVTVRRTGWVPALMLLAAGIAGAAIALVAPVAPLCAAIAAIAAVGGAVGVILALRRGRDDLASSHAALERRVEDRTAALAESEQRLRRVQQIGRVGGFEIDLRSGANLRSAEYMSLHGADARETLERHEDWVRRLHPEDRARAERHFLDAIADGGPVDYAQEYRVLVNGAVRWIAARAEITRDAAGRALRMVGAHMDVTELREAQAALAETAQRSREVLESLGDMLYALDAEGRIRFASRRALEAWGRAPEAVLGRRFADAFAAARGSTSLDAIEAAARAGTALHLCAVSPLFGRWFELDIHPAAGGGVTVAARDIHDRRALEIERRRAEGALRESEARLRLALEAAGLGTWEIDVASGQAIRSPRTLEIFGMGEGESTGAAPVWRNRIHPEDRPGFEAALAPVRAGVATRYAVQYRFLRPDGGWRWVESQGLVVASDPATGAPTRLIGTTLDITERKAAEERQRLLTREVDHRAKNALTVVLAALRLTPKDDAVAFAETIEGRVSAIARAQSLLAEGRWSGADLRSLAEGEVAAFLPPAGGGEAAPRAVLAGAPVTLRPEAVQAISMALHELSTNAMKYGALSEPEGEVRLTWRLEEEALRLCWRESGGPAIEVPPARRGFGSRLLTATIRDQLGGTVTCRWEPEGLVCVMAMPGDRVLAVPGAGELPVVAE